MESPQIPEGPDVAVMRQALILILEGLVIIRDQIDELKEEIRASRTTQSS